MYEQVEKTPEQKSQSVANTISQRQKSHAPTSRFVDNRPEAIQMQKLRDLAKNSPQNSKLRELHHLAATHSVAQKKSNVKQGFGFVDNRDDAIAQRKLVGAINTIETNIIQMTGNQHPKAASGSGMARVDPGHGNVKSKQHAEAREKKDAKREKKRAEEVERLKQKRAAEAAAKAA